MKIESNGQFLKTSYLGRRNFALPLSNDKVLSELHPSKLPEISVTEFGICMYSRLTHPLKQPDVISFIRLSSIFSKLMHPLKPLLPTLTTLCGKVIFFSKIQLAYLLLVDYQCYTL